MSEQTISGRIDEQTMKYSQSACPPVLRLPPEILCEIFQQTRLECESIEWISITHVCRQWRNTALKSPMLWTEIPLSNTRWAEEMLARSGTCKLVVPVDSDSWSFSSWTHALKHVSHIKELDVTTTLEKWDQMQQDLPLTSPELEVLRLTLCFRDEDPYESAYMDDWDEDEDEPRQISIPDEFFNDTAKLRCLDLWECKINWSSHLLRRPLTHLSLIHVGSQSRPSTTQLFSILVELAPTLEYLVLINALPGFTDSTSEKSVYLKYLRYLKTYGKDIEVKSFFRYAVFPPTAAVVISTVAPWTGRYDADSYAGHSDLFSSLSKSYPSSDTASVFQTLVASNTYVESCLFLQCLSEVAEKPIIFDDTDVVKPKSSLNFFFYWKYDTRGPECVNVLTELFESRLPLHNIVNVDMGTSFYWDGYDRTLGRYIRLPQSVHLVLGQYNIESFIETSGEAKDTGHTSEIGLYFPCLTSLCILGPICFLSNTCKNKRGRYIGRAQAISIEPLRDCLIRRHKDGVGLKKLFFVNCTFGKGCHKILSTFREFVEDVNCSGPPLISS